MRTIAVFILMCFTIPRTYAQCETDICGYWYSENYNSGVPVEYVAIDMVDGKWVAVKILGDPYVPTGHITWQGIPSSCTFSGQVFVTTGIGQPIVPLSATIGILSESHIRVMPPGLDFFPTTLDHLNLEGVDHSSYPISCFPCDSPFPNVFTPNGDGVNDLLVPICGGPSHRFSITDRWGRVVFETLDPKPVWDGRNEWIPCSEGVYFWSMIKADDRTGKVYHGVVQLLR